MRKAESLDGTFASNKSVLGLAILLHNLSNFHCLQRPVEFPALLRKSQGHEAKIFSKLPRETLFPPHDVTSQHRCFTRRSVLSTAPSTKHLRHILFFFLHILSASPTPTLTISTGPCVTGTMSRTHAGRLLPPPPPPPPFLPYVKVAIQLSTVRPRSLRPNHQARREGPKQVPEEE